MADRHDTDWESEGEFFKDLTEKGGSSSGEGLVNDVKRLQKQLDIANGLIRSLNEQLGAKDLEIKGLKAASEMFKDRVEDVERAADARDPKGYCADLGLDPDLLGADDQKMVDEQIRGLYRVKAKPVHPDAGVFKKEVADEKFKILNEANDFLSDRGNRRNYGTRAK